MLLQKLHDTRMCDQLLEQDTTEGVWKAGQGSGSDAVLSRAKSLEGTSAWRVWVLNYYGILEAFREQPNYLSISHIFHDPIPRTVQNLCENIKDILLSVSLDAD